MYTQVVNCHVKNANAVVYGNSQYASGGFAYKASEMSVFEGCTVDGLQLVITGDSDNFGGFIGEIGLASTATACSVNNVNVVVNGQSRAGMGGFMGDTVGGTGWGDSVHITDCTVSNTDITVNTVNSPIGGFVGDLIGGRSAFFEDNTVADSVCITGTNIGDGKATGTPGVGGFLGGLFGRSNLAANNEHSFTSCTTSAVINAGAAPAGGFVGSAVMGNGNQMRVIFEDCAFDGKVVTTNTAVAFVGIGDIGTKGTDKNYDEYINCTVSGATIIGTAPEAQQITLGGAFSYEMEAGNGYSTLETTINQDTTYSTYKQPVAEEPAQPAMVMFRMRRNVMPAATNDLVKVEFYLNTEATEPLHSFERYLNTALDGTNYPALDESPEYALTEAQLTKIFGFMAHEDGLAQVTWLMEDGTEFTPSTLVTDNIKVYASFSSASTNATLEGEVSMDDVLADGYEFVLMQGEDVLQTVSPVNGKFTFATIDFSKEGTYTFTVAQVIGNNETTVYDKSVYTVTITVSLVDGEIVTNVEFKLNDASVEKIAFSNKTINSVKVNLNGNSYMDDDFSDDFEFALEENGETKQTMFSIFGEFSTRLTFNKVGTYTFNIRQVVGDDETTVYDESVYTVIVNVTREDDTLVATTQLLLDGEAVDEISFSNETKVPETPTKPPKDGDGIYNVMFVMLVSMALLGSCVALKRKEN
jgi:pilin isopeptide linkage protein